ncbi:MAG: nitroreductase family deazaflavin-dependent oxidoreductase [Nocardia sp.]|nr:nitroreductase family deazaflavin-dependent oxidoreductase [Nocardia sp.]
MTEIDKGKLASDNDALDSFNRGIIDEFRTGGGAVTGLPGGRILLLHNTGARSGKVRVTPLAYVTIDDRLLVIGSYLGASRDPAWVHNLRAHPRARIEIGTETHAVVARELPRHERNELFGRVVELAPVLGKYQAATERPIPLIELIRA